MNREGIHFGTYHNNVDGEVEIAPGRDGLVMRIGPLPLDFRMRAYDHDTFSRQPAGEHAAGRSGLSFLIGLDDNAVAFRDEYLENREEVGWTARWQEHLSPDNPVAPPPGYPDTLGH